MAALDNFSPRSATVTSLARSDSHVRLQAENVKLKLQLRKAFAAVYFWKEEALFAQAERDFYREQERET